MPGRTYSASSSYRYGFNGKENDNEVKGDGNQYDYGFRIYDSRIGRFLSVDPLIDKYPELTPYQFSSNSPIANVDVDGQESYWYQFDINKKTGEVTVKLTAVKKSWLDWITPSHLVVKIGDHDWEYAFDHCKSCGHLDEEVQKIKADPEGYYEDLMERRGKHDEYIARRNADDKKMEEMMWSMAFAMKYSQSKAVTTTVATEEQAVVANNKVAPSGQKVSTGAASSPAATKTSSQKAATITPKPAAGSQATPVANVLSGKFSQPNHSNNFSDRGQKILKVQAIPEAVTNLKNGTWSPSKLPIDYVVRNNQVFYLNTRSTASLIEAGIPRTQWTFVNRTGNPKFEKNLTNNLGGNTEGYNEVTNRQTGKVTRL